MHLLVSVAAAIAAILPCLDPGHLFCPGRRAHGHNATARPESALRGAAKPGQYDPGARASLMSLLPAPAPPRGRMAEAKAHSPSRRSKAPATGFFGQVSMDLAQVIEYAFQRAGRPNGYILGEEAGGAFIAGLRYGEGTLYTKDAGNQRVFWQGPSVGYDFGAEGSKTMVLVYDLYSPGEIFNTYPGVDGSAYFIGGVGITFLARDHVRLAPIRSGIGLRLGANVGYLKYTRQPTWNPF